MPSLSAIKQSPQQKAAITRRLKAEAQRVRWAVFEEAYEELIKQYGVAVAGSEDVFLTDIEPGEASYWASFRNRK